MRMLILTDAWLCANELKVIAIDINFYVSLIVASYHNLPDIPQTFIYSDTRYRSKHGCRNRVGMR